MLSGVPLLLSLYPNFMRQTLISLKISGGGFVYHLFLLTLRVECLKGVRLDGNEQEY